MELRFRFRHDATTVLLDSSEEIGVLNPKTAMAMSDLRTAAPAVKFKPFLSRKEDNDTCDRQSTESSSILPIDIEVYGSKRYYNEVGSILSDAGMYLQEPIPFRSEMPYCNPHFFSWDENMNTPLIAQDTEDEKVDFAKRLEAIFDSSASISQDPPLAQDTRISTKLRRYGFECRF